jgi:hypothetical protein
VPLCVTSSSADRFHVSEVCSSKGTRHHLAKEKDQAPGRQSPLTHELHKVSRRVGTLLSGSVSYPRVRV